MNLIQRVQDVLLKPAETWPAIAAEPATVKSIYTDWLVYLAAIPVVAGFIGFSLVGVAGWRLPFFSGLVHLLVSYVLSLVVAFVMALIVDALAPSFGGTKDPIAALKVVAYGSTASYVGGVFSLLPALSVLGVLASLYSIYLIYTALPVFMRCPPEKAVAYTAVVIVCGIVAMLVLGAVTGSLLPGRMGRLTGALPAPIMALYASAGEVHLVARAV